MSRRRAGAVGLLAFLLAAGCRSSTTAPAPGGPSEEGAAITVTSQELAKEFDDDWAAAAGRYRGKWLVVAGPVHAVEVAPDGAVAVRLAGAKAETKKLAARGVRCIVVPSAADRARALSKGQAVKLKGKFDAEMLGQFVEVMDCELVEVGPEQVVEVTAEQLTRDYARDEEAADAKYKDRWLLIDGAVAVLKESNNGPRLVLQGFDEKSARRVRVSARYPDGLKAEVGKYTQGQRVKIKGECCGVFLDHVLIDPAVPVK